MANAKHQWRSSPPGDPEHVLATINFDPVSEDVFACPAPRLVGDWHAEYWGAATVVRECELGGWQIRYSDRLAFAACHIDAAATTDVARLEAAVSEAYRGLFAARRALGLVHIQRIWHWLYRLLDGVGEDQRYRVMCRGRAQAIDEADSDLVLPPATGVEGWKPGLRLQAIMGDNPIVPVENPRQISAYHYPPEHGRRAPAFARAAICRLGDDPWL